MDSACGYAALTLMEPDVRVLTVELKVNLLSVASGERLLARGQVIRPRPHAHGLPGGRLRRDGRGGTPRGDDPHDDDRARRGVALVAQGIGEFFDNSSSPREQSCRYMDRCSRRSSDRSEAIGTPRRQTVWRTSAGSAPARSNRHARRQLPAYRLTRGLNPNAFRGEFSEPDPPGGAAQADCASRGMIND